MPYELRKKGDKWCVHKRGESDPIDGGCHESRADAVKHVRALYAAEGVKMGEDTGMSHGEMWNLLSLALGSDVYVVDVFDDSVVYQTGLGIGETAKTLRRSYSISEDGEVTLGDPERVRRRTMYEPMKMSVEFGAPKAVGPFVLRRGKIFEAADYPDKDVSFDEADIAGMVANFKPVPINLDHEETPLSHDAFGNTLEDPPLGHLEHVENIGGTLFGVVRIPAWLDSMFEGEAIPCSVEIRDDRLVGIALCRNPRVSGAALLSAVRKSLPSHKKESTVMNPIAALHAFLVSAFTKAKEDGSLPKELSGVDPATVNFAEKTDPAPKPEENPELASLRANFNAMRDETIRVHAEQFAKDTIADRRAFPAEKAALVDLYARALRLDNSGTAVFSTAGGENVAAVKALIAARPQHSLIQAATSADGGAKVEVIALSQSEQPVAMTPERKAELRGLGSIKVPEKS